MTFTCNFCLILMICCFDTKARFSINRLFWVIDYCIPLSLLLIYLWNLSLGCIFIFWSGWKFVGVLRRLYRDLYWCFALQANLDIIFMSFIIEWLKISYLSRSSRCLRLEALLKLDFIRAIEFVSDLKISLMRSSPRLYA